MGSIKIIINSDNNSSTNSIDKFGVSWGKL